MTYRQALAAVMQLFVLFVFFAAGCFFVLLPIAPDARIILSDALLHSPDDCIWIGLCCFSLVLVCLLGFYGVNRGRFLLLRMGQHLLEVDEDVIQQTVNPIFQKKFGNKIALADVEILRRRELKFGVRLEAMQEEEREQTLAEAEKQLSVLLQERFGYRRPFTVQISTSEKF